MAWTPNACAMATAVLMVTVAVLMAGAPGLAQDVDGVVYIDGPVNVTLTNDIFPLCTPTLDDLPEDATAEDVEALQSVFEEQAASVLDRFVPCAFGSPARPSWRCCRSLASIFGFYEEVCTCSSHLKLRPTNANDEKDSNSSTEASVPSLSGPKSGHTILTTVAVTTPPIFRPISPTAFARPVYGMPFLPASSAASIS